MSQIRVSIAKRVVLFAESIYDFFHRGIARLTGQLKKPMTAEIYYAVEHDTGVAIKGRISKIRKWRKPRPDDGAMRNLWQMLKLWATPERPHALVRVVRGKTVEAIRADDEGYFEISLPLEGASSQKIEVSLPESQNAKRKMLVPRRSSQQSRYVIISDIDDTVLISNAAKFFQMIGTTLFGNAFTRQIFPGAPALYQSLRKGVTPGVNEKNPFAYVTSSPFNLHSLLSLIFKENKVPGGAFFMTDWGIDHEKWFKKSHSDHKLGSIREALGWYPNRPVLLIGDSGQHDTQIYAQIAEEFGSRIGQILVRNVSDKNRIESLTPVVDRIVATGVPFAFFDDSRGAAAVLESGGWITEDQHQLVREAYDEATSTPIDEFMEAVKK